MDAVVLGGWRRVVQQDDDAVLVALIEDLGGDLDALPGGHALRYIYFDVHLLFPSTR